MFLQSSPCEVFDRKQYASYMVAFAFAKSAKSSQTRARCSQNVTLRCELHLHYTDSSSLKEEHWPNIGLALISFAFQPSNVAFKEKLVTFQLLVVCAFYHNVAVLACRHDKVIVQLNKV